MFQVRSHWTMHLQCLFHNKHRWHKRVICLSLTETVYSTIVRLEHSATCEHSSRELQDAHHRAPRKRLCSKCCESRWGLFPSANDSTLGELRQPSSTLRCMRVLQELSFGNGWRKRFVKVKILFQVRAGARSSGPKMRCIAHVREELPKCAPNCEGD